MKTKEITARLKQASLQYNQNETYTYHEPGLDQEIEVRYIGKFDFTGEYCNGVYHMFTDTETPLEPITFLFTDEEANESIR